MYYMYIHNKVGALGETGDGTDKIPSMTFLLAELDLDIDISTGTVHAGISQRDPASRECDDVHRLRALRFGAILAFTVTCRSAALEVPAGSDCVVAFTSEKVE